MIQQHKTLEPVFEAFDVEIDEKALPNIGQLHVGKQLRLVDAEQALHTFEFEDDLVLYQDIDAVSAVQQEALVADRKRVLQKERNALEF